MIKILTKLFGTPEEIEESTVTIEVEPEVPPVVEDAKPEPTPRELFDIATERVVYEMLHQKLQGEFELLCYTDETIEQTRAAIKEMKEFDYNRVTGEGWECRVDGKEYHGHGPDSTAQSFLADKYPKANVSDYDRDRGRYFCLPFNLNSLIYKLVRENYDSLKHTTK